MGAAGEFAFDGGEDAFDQGAFSIREATVAAAPGSIIGRRVGSEAETYVSEERRAAAGELSGLDGLQLYRIEYAVDVSCSFILAEFADALY